MIGASLRKLKGDGIQGTNIKVNDRQDIHRKNQECLQYVVVSGRKLVALMIEVSGI